MDTATVMKSTPKLVVLVLLAFQIMTVSTPSYSDDSVYATAANWNPGPQSLNSPQDALGPPDDGPNTQPAVGANSAQLGVGGDITLHFGETAVQPSGDARGDIRVYEVGAPEGYSLEISSDGQSWIPAGSIGSGGGMVDIDGLIGMPPNTAYSYVRITDDSQSTYSGADIDAVSVAPAPPDEDKDLGCRSKSGEGPGRGNPCNVSNGNKYQSETDTSLPGLRLTRYYNSGLFYDSGFGIGWTSNYHKRLIHKDGKTIVLRANGYSEAWQDSGGVLVGDPDSRYTVQGHSGGHTLNRRNGSTENYNSVGLLVSETTPAGQTTTYAYGSEDQLLSVTGPYGHTLTFAYDEYGRVETVTDDAGKVTTYRYSGSLLTKVIYADGATKDYRYDNASYYTKLTGIIDENGNQYATWGYDSLGRVISSEHADISGNGGQERVTFTYDSPTQTTVTDSVGDAEVLTFSVNLGTKNLVNQVYLSDGKGISQVFDAYNNLASETDAEGRTTTYLYNSFNQMVAMTEAAGSAEQRTTTYEYLSGELDLVTSVTVTVSP